MQKLSRFMAREVALASALESVVSLVVEFMACDSCLLYLLQDRELVLCASNNPQPETLGHVRLKLGEGLDRPGWRANAGCSPFRAEAYQDPRFKLFTDLPEDAYDAFLSAPVIVHNRVAGVINVQHRAPHFHSGGEMELLTTVGEQVGALVALSLGDLSKFDPAGALDLVMTPVRRSRAKTCAVAGTRLLVLAPVLLLAPALFAERWTIQYFYDVDRSKLEIVDLAFPTAQRGIAVGWTGDPTSDKKVKPTALLTNDGGAHWTLESLKDEPRSIFFLNE